jgi:sugar phosphate isomerase/epimerase
MWDENPSVLFEIISKIDKKNLKICFDPGHFNVFSNVKIGNWIKILSDKISLIHLSDNLSDFDSHLELGKGNIDWEDFSQYYEIFCKSADITFEINSLQGIINSDKYLKENKIFPYQNKRFMSNVKVF